MRTGPVEPGSTHDPTVAGLHVPPALHRSARPAMPVLASKGYQGAGIGILVPMKNPRPETPDKQTRNNPLSALRTPAERGAPCSSTSGPCNESPPGPAAIATIMAAALVIITLRHDSRHEPWRERLNGRRAGPVESAIRI